MKRLLSALLLIALVTSTITGVNAKEIKSINSATATSDKIYTTPKEAGAYLRQCMVNRQETVIIKYNGDTTDVLKRIFKEAIRHTGVPKEGDYLIWNHISWGATGEYVNGVRTYTFKIKYRTTKAQEAVVDSKVKSVLSSMNLKGKSDYVKVRTIYHYICNHVTFDDTVDATSDIKKSTYGALINQKAVCQGFASLFYRLALEAGVDCRFIKGDATKVATTYEHGWNIVKLGDKYYNLDVTWDSFNIPYSFQYYLKGSNNFKDHVVRVNSSYLEHLPAEYKSYNISTTDYKYTDSDLIINGNCGSNIKWSFNNGTKTLRLSGKGSMPNFITTQSNLKLAPWKNLKAEKLIIDSGITNIGDNAFFGFKNLKSISIPSTVKTIGKQAFYNCDNLKTVTIPSSVTTIGNIAFGYKYQSSTSNQKIVGFTINGYADTAADSYARKYSFKMVKKYNMAKAIVTVNSATYTGSALKPTVKVKYGNTTLVKDVNYTVSYTNNVNAGKGTVKITGKGNYTGTITKTFTIAKRGVSKLTYSKISNKAYTGKQIKPSITVKYNGRTLTKGISYTVSYGKNKSTGKATIKITGKGNYTGSITKTFYIVPKKVTISSAKSSAKKKLTVKYKKVTGASGYQIAYQKSGSKKWTYTTVSSKSASKTLTKLTSKKNYKVKVRAYKTVSGKKYYGTYSATKTVKVK
ncbi:MAG: leucine-rich repeat protein [Coprobacillus sp.]|nr:leucine-rich repeat protein [Coprobacillus sp.]